MNLDLINKIVNNAKNNELIQNFIKELQNYLENNMLKVNNANIEKEDIALINPTHNGNKIISMYRDKMLIERSNILNQYAKKTADKGKMYYIYSKNSKMLDTYNLCICEESKSHTIIEESINNLPKGAEIGSVLREAENHYNIDEEATKEIAKEIYNMKSELLREQTEFLNSKRIEGHIYEVSENDGDRVWLFDITNSSNEGIEEIDFPKELLQSSKEGDLFAYINGKYTKSF